VRRALVLIVLAACGRVGFDARTPPQDGAISDGDAAVTAYVPPWQSGSRLRARLLVGDGDPIFYGWHDTQLASDCQPAIAADGQERCLPFRARADTMFSDPACTQPLALVYKATCGHDTYAFAQTAQTHEYPIGALYTGTAYSNQAGCTASAPPANTELHVIGGEALPSLFVASNYDQRMVGSFMHSFNVFADGASQDIGILNIPDGPCRPTATALGPSRCRANALQAQIAYTDASCTQQVLLWVRQVYDPPTASQLIVLTPDACNTSYQLYQTIAQVTPATYYQQTVAGCTGTTTASNTILYTATAISDPFPVGTVIRGPRRGRIGTLYWRGPDDVDVEVGKFDQDLGNPCVPFNGADGVLRCLPAAPSSETAYPNGTCAGTTTAVYASCFGATPVNGPTYTSCIDGWRVHGFATQYESASLDFDGTCTPLSLPGGTAVGAPLGSELPPSMFPPLTEMVE
jgi:hypothetical protein